MGPLAQRTELPDRAIATRRCDALFADECLPRRGCGTPTSSLPLPILTCRAQSGPPPNGMCIRDLLTTSAGVVSGPFVPSGPAVTPIRSVSVSYTHLRAHET